MAFVAGMPELSVAIVVVVVLNGVFAFVQEHRADRAGERLRALLPLRVTVRRDGRVQDVAARELVVGDYALTGVFRPNRVQAYADVLRDTEILRIRQENLTVLQRQLDESSARFEVGEITRTDVAQSEARLAQSEADLANAQAQLSVSRAGYAAVVGQRVVTPHA